VVQIRRSLLLIVFCLAPLLGCGGGGGLIKLVYFTDWTGGQSSMSQRIRIADPSGGGFTELVMNNTTGGQQSIEFSNLKKGSYIVRVWLYSLPNAGGTLLGEINDLAAFTASTSNYRTKVTGTATQVVVSPSQASIPVQRSIQLYAVVRDAQGDTLFVPPGSFQWTALNGHASVNQEGIVVGETQGQGVIRAFEINSGLQNTAVINVTPIQTTTTKWTILVFLNAANDLDTFSDLNVNQMERVANNAEVRFVVQWKRVQSLGFGAPWTGTRRYLVRYDNNPNNGWEHIQSELIQDLGTGVDMGAKETLRDFINWGMTFYPAERYVVVVWNHGSGWRDELPVEPTRGVSFDDEFGTYIKTYELAQALDSINTIDILSWDASLMQMIEVAYEVKDRVSYVVGSEESPPGEGLPYHLVFGPLRDNPNLATETFLQHFGLGMLQFYGESRAVTQSSVRTSQMQNLATALNALGNQLIATSGAYNAEVQQVRQTSEAYGAQYGHIYRDLGHVCQRIKALIPHAGIANACDDVLAAIQAAVVHNHKNSHRPNATGLSIEFGPGTQPYWNTYDLLSLSVATSWNDWCRISP